MPGGDTRRQASRSLPPQTFAGRRATCLQTRLRNFRFTLQAVGYPAGIPRLRPGETLPAPPEGQQGFLAVRQQGFCLLVFQALRVTADDKSGYGQSGSSSTSAAAQDANNQPDHCHAASSAGSSRAT
mmetsp:Transcript_26427/g.46805  ORF Transcript_26427/g.46805 Transcript_26427/m.46805 type:complete len:127 (+) Transcript_26427:746-1126(+)